MQHVIHVNQPNDHEFGSFLRSFGVEPPYRIVPLDGGTQNNAYRIEQRNMNHLIMIQYGPNVLELNISDALACMNQLNILGLSVPHVLQNKHKLLVQPVSDTDPEVIGTVMTFLQGEPLGQNTPNQLIILAKTLARMHLHTKSLHAIPHNTFSIQGFGLLLETLELAQMNKSHAAILHNAVKRLEDQDFSNLPKGFIHGDLFADNCMFNGNELTGIIDFDFCGHDLFAYDIAITLLGCVYNHNPYRYWQQLEELFIQAYNEVRRLEEAEWDALSMLKIAAAVRFSLTRITDEVRAKPTRPSRDMVEILTLLY